LIYKKILPRKLRVTRWSSPIWYHPSIDSAALRLFQERLGSPRTRPVFQQRSNNHRCGTAETVPAELVEPVAAVLQTTMAVEVTGICGLVDFVPIIFYPGFTYQVVAFESGALEANAG